MLKFDFNYQTLYWVLCNRPVVTLCLRLYSDHYIPDQFSGLQGSGL